MITYTVPKDITAIKYDTIPANLKGKIRQVILHDKITSIESFSFQSCARLGSISIPESVTSIDDGAFEGCKNLRNVELPKELQSIEKHIFKDCRKLKSISIPESVTSIEEGAFEGCVNLNDIKLPKQLQLIGRYAFWGCNSLDSISIPEGVESIEHGAFSGDAFLGFKGLDRVSIPGSVKSIEFGAFNGCESNIEFIVNGIPGHVRSNEFCGSDFWKKAAMHFKDFRNQFNVNILGGDVTRIDLSVEETGIFLRKAKIETQKDDQSNQLSNDNQDIFCVDAQFLDENCEENPYDHLLKVLRAGKKLNSDGSDSEDPFDLLDPSDGFELTTDNESNNVTIYRYPHFNDGTKKFHFEERTLADSVSEIDIKLPTRHDVGDGSVLNTDQDIDSLGREYFIKAAILNRQPTLFFVRELCLRLVVGKFSERNDGVLNANQEKILLNKLLESHLLDQPFLSALIGQLETDKTKGIDALAIAQQNKDSTDSKIGDDETATIVENTANDHNVEIANMIKSFVKKDDLLTAYFKANGVWLDQNESKGGFFNTLLWKAKALFHAIRRVVKSLLGYRFESEFLKSLENKYQNDKENQFENNANGNEELRKAHEAALRQYYGENRDGKESGTPIPTAKLKSKLKHSTFARLYEAYTGRSYKLTDQASDSQNKPPEL